MCGRFFIGLLVLSSLIIATPPAITAQADRALPMPEDLAILPPVYRLPQPVPFRLPAAPTALSQMSRAAGMIFSGQVTGIARVRASGGELESVAVTFRVEHAIRGVRAGRSLTINQWMGLWSGGERYRIGERMLLFLYPRSRLGLTSTVGGPLGRFAVDSRGRVLLSNLHLSAFAADPVLAGKSHVTFSDFVQGVRRASEEE